MSTAALQHVPPLATTGVGSLPFADPVDAVAHITRAYEMPFCPQLPRHDGDMLQEWLGSNPGHCGWSRDRDRERPAAWDAFLAQLREDPPGHGVVKLQVTGPVTLAAALERACGRRGLGPEAHALATEIAGWLAANAQGRVRELAALGFTTLLIVDEPRVASAGLTPKHAAIWDPLRAVAPAWGLHVCGPVPWSLIDETQPDAVSFDLTRGALDPTGRQALAHLLNRNGRILWGVIDPARPSDVSTAAARLIAAMSSLDDIRRSSQGDLRLHAHSRLRQRPALHRRRIAGRRHPQRSRRCRPRRTGHRHHPPTPTMSEPTRMVEVVFPNMLNHQANLFGGHALRMMDTAAFVAATRQARHTMVTAGVHEVHYKAPVHQGEIVEISAEILAIGRTSVQVAVEMVVEELLTGNRTVCGHGRFAFVAVDQHGTPAPVARHT